MSAESMLTKAAVSLIADGKSHYRVMLCGAFIGNVGRKPGEHTRWEAFSVHDDNLKPWGFKSRRAAVEWMVRCATR